MILINNYLVLNLVSFEYIETPDQLTAINDVKKDLEKNIPMDRLIFGDVGFGKTEVALRAAIKVAFSGGQVALLAPTTILVQQHIDTFVDRLKDYPLNIKHLSRFVTKKEVQNIVEGVKDGSVDILIGTHRILSDDIEFQNLKSRFFMIVGSSVICAAASLCSSASP